MSFFLLLCNFYFLVGTLGFCCFLMYWLGHKLVQFASDMDVKFETRLAHLLFIKSAIFPSSLPVSWFFWYSTYPEIRVVTRSPKSLFSDRPITPQLISSNSFFSSPWSSLVLLFVYYISVYEMFVSYTYYCVFFSYSLFLCWSILYLPRINEVV